jgi:hypothetical protein
LSALWEAQVDNTRTRFESKQCVYNGPYTGSIGSIVAEWTAQEQPCKKKKQRNRKRRTV